MKRKITRERFVDVRRLLDVWDNPKRPEIQAEIPEPGYFSSNQIQEISGKGIRRVQSVIQGLLRSGDLGFKKFRIRCSPVSVRLTYLYKARTRLAREMIMEKLSCDIRKIVSHEKKAKA